MSAYAQTADDSPAVSISAIPSILDIGGKTGENVRFNINIKNRSELVLPVQLDTRPMLGMEGETDAFVQANNASQWIRFDEEQILLAAGETRTVSGSFKIPSGAGPGGRYADIVVRPLSTMDASGAIRAQPELAVRVLARISGNAIEKMETIPLGPRIFVSGRPAQQSLAFVVKNDGNVHELIYPVLHITRGGRDTLTKASEPMIILPRESRRITFGAVGSLGGGLYDAQLKYDYGAPKVSANSPSYRLIVLPFPPAVLMLIPAGLFVFLVWRYQARVLRAVRILIKGNKAGN